MEENGIGVSDITEWKDIEPITVEVKLEKR